MSTRITDTHADLILRLALEGRAEFTADEGVRWIALADADPAEGTTNQVAELAAFPIRLNHVQSFEVTGVPDGGTFTVEDWANPTPNESAAIDWDATASELEAILEALGEIGVGNVLCTGGPFPGDPILCEYVRTLQAQDVPGVTLADNSLTGGTTPTVAILDDVTGINLLTAFVDADGEVERETDNSVTYELGEATGPNTATHLVLLTAETAGESRGSAPLSAPVAYSSGQPVHIPAGSLRIFSRGAS